MEKNTCFCSFNIWSSYLYLVVVGVCVCLGCVCVDVIIKTFQNCVYSRSKIGISQSKSRRLCSKHANSAIWCLLSHCTHSYVRLKCKKNIYMCIYILWALQFKFISHDAVEISHTMWNVNGAMCSTAAEKIALQGTQQLLAFEQLQWRMDFPYENYLE